MAYHKILRRISCCFKAISLCIPLVSKLRLNVFKSRMASRKEDKTILSQTRILLILKWCCCLVLLNFGYSSRSLSFSKLSRERNERKSRDSWIKISCAVSLHKICKYMLHEWKTYVTVPIYDHRMWHSLRRFHTIFLFQQYVQLKNETKNLSRLTSAVKYESYYL